MHDWAAELQTSAERLETLVFIDGLPESNQWATNSQS